MYSNLNIDVSLSLFSFFENVDNNKNLTMSLLTFGLENSSYYLLLCVYGTGGWPMIVSIHEQDTGKYT